MLKTFLAATGFFLTVAALADESWTPWKCPEPVRALQDRIQPIAAIDANPAAWKVSSGEQNAKATIRPMQDRLPIGVDYEFIGKTGLEYVALLRDVAVPENADGIAFRVASEKRLPINVRIADRSGEIHQFGLEQAPGDGPHLAVALFRGGHAWGGDGNQQLDRPLKLDSIIFDRATVGYRGKGTLALGDLAWVRPASHRNALSIEIKTPRFGNVYAPGESVSLRAKAPAGQIRCRLEDFFGLTTDKKESAIAAEVTFAFPRPGFFTLVCENVVDSLTVESRVVRLAVIEPIAEPARDAFLGFCTHFGHGSYPLESMDLLNRYGFRRFRDEISWGDFERKRGEYAMPAQAVKFLGHSKELGMEPLLIFDYANRLYDNGGYPNSQEAMAAYGAYCAELVRQTTGMCRDFEIWNEWIGGCGMHNRPGDHGPEAYGRLMKAAAEKVRPVAPKARIIGVGGEYGPKCCEIVEKMFRTAGKVPVDAYSLHPYRYPRPPESSELVGEVRRIAKQAVGAGAPPSIWVTEIGYPTHAGQTGSDERSQAALSVRTAALLQAMGGIEKVYWYDFKDDGLTREYNEHNFGVVLHQEYHCAPKPAAVALSVFARQTAGAKLLNWDASGGTNLLAYQLPNGKKLLVAWSASKPVRLEIGGKIELMVDLIGAAKPVASRVAIDANAIYVIGNDLTWQIIEFK